MIDSNLTSKRKSELTDEERVRSFQRKLYFKAKQEKESQSKCKLYRRNAFDKLVNKYGLINPVVYKYV